MHQDLVELVDMALMDGVLSDKQREIITKKAEKLGEDLDEFEIWLEGKIAIAKRKFPLSTAQSASQSNKQGDLKKCPACGAPVESFVTKCSDCGYEFRDIEATASIQQLFKIINEIESERKEGSSNPLSAYGKLIASGMGVNTDKVTTKIIMTIQNFPIPNTKEDILEFLSLAVPNAKIHGNFLTSKNPENKAHNNLAPTWKSKCEQIVIKARFSLKDDKKTLEAIEKYAKELEIK